MDGKGWIKLHRQIQDCWIWTDDDKFDKTHAWIDLLLLANHRDKKIAVDGKPKVITRSQFLTSKKKLADRWNWNIKTVRKFLEILENDGMITQEVTSRWTTITILNYEVYQDVMDNSMDNSTDTSVDTSMVDTMVGSMVGSMDTNKNDKNIKNDKNDKNERNNNNNNTRGEKPSRFIPPTVDEVREYCEERNNDIDAEDFVDFYTSKGWMVGKNKMKDWRSAVRTWERSRKKKASASSVQRKVYENEDGSIDWSKV